MKMSQSRFRVIFKRFYYEDGHILRQPIQNEKDHTILGTWIKFRYYFIDTEEKKWYKLQGKHGFHLYEVSNLNRETDEFINDILKISCIDYDTLQLDDDGCYEITVVTHAFEITHNMDEIRYVMNRVGTYLNPLQTQAFTALIKSEMRI